MLKDNYFDSNETRKLIYQYEAWLDENLLAGKITQEVAWDCYFGLLHECDLLWLWDDRDRILKKIDIAKYNPFQSKNPNVIMIARIRSRAI